jgi:hypothetical protein
MKRMVTWVAIAMAIAGCKSKQAEQTTEPSPKPVAVLESMPIEPLKGRHEHPPEPRPGEAPEIRARPAPPTPETAVAVAARWLSAIDSGKVDSVLAQMGDRVRIRQDAYPTAVTCPGSDMDGQGHADLTTIAVCAVDVLGEAAATLSTRVKARDESLGWIEDAGLAYAGSSVSRGGDTYSAVVAVATTPGGPRVVAAEIHRELSGE